jgi:formylglycine-generating enzyme required for sulfatase activity
LRWTAASDFPTVLTAAPSAASTADSTTITLASSDFSYSYNASVTITNAADPSDFRTILVRIENTIQLVSVPSGTFVMGHRPDEFGSSAELPNHNVTLSDYSIGRYEITNGQLADLLNWAHERGYLENDSQGPYSGGGIYFNQKRLIFNTLPEHECAVLFQNGRFVVQAHESQTMEEHPAGSVTWYGAVMFCNWLSEKAGLVPCYGSGDWILNDPVPNGYRLPTEAEWERAAAWDASLNKHWIYPDQNDTYDKHHMNYDTANPVGFAERPYTSPIGFYNGLNAGTFNSVSPVGCYDMGGGVMEWCYDRYGAYAPDDQTDPTGASYGPDKVIRGGGWCEDESAIRSASRTMQEPTFYSSCVGFRVAINGLGL